MSQPETPQSAAASASGGQLEGGAYEIIRNRLSTHAATLRSRLGELNNARKDVFGSIETALVNTDRITTANNCIPRDMVPVGRRFLFGYNVHFGLRTERHLADVFAIYEFSDGHFHEQPLDLIQEERFQKDFHDVYRFYRDAVFSRFFLKGPHLYMVFRVGRSVSDIKTFKWAIDGDRLKYIDNRSDHEVTFPPQHEFEWVRTHRDLHQSGTHPHISIEDRVFVETVGGDLTIKVENNTESGEGILSEPVDDPDQTLDDAEVLYASLDNLILLKIRPYQEKQFRYFVFNEKLQQATRLDAIAEACVRLPDDHGLIYSSGYYLQAGDSRRFDSDLTAMMFDRRIAAPNGEDYLYVFTHRESGTYALLAYNLISQEVSVPLVCNGFSFFENGELLCFRCHEEPQKHHAIQIWQTPFVGENHVPETHTDSYLYRIGNREIVRGMAECQELLNLLDKDDSWSGRYVDVVKKAGDVLDSYFWLDREETCRLDEPLKEIRGAASAAVEEFEKVVRVRRETEQKTTAVASATTGILKQSNNRRYETIDDFVSSLGDLRRVRGDIISLRELRYADSARITRLEEQVTEQTERISHRCVQFLLSEGALDPYAARVAEAAARVPHLEKVAEAKQVAEAIDTGAAELEMLIEIVSNLPISDATRRTQIIDQISAIFTEVNQARAALRRRQQELFAVEGTAEFSSQLKLLNQAVVNLLDVADTPEKCDTSLTRVMIQLEELEGRFAEFDEFVVQLSEKRDEIYNAFESRKLSLVEARNRRAAALGKAADRILTGIRSRAESLESISEINGYFAGDLMIAKVRDLVSQLEGLDDSVRVDDIRSRLKSIQEDTVRQLKDRQELFVGGENIIRLGQHQFSVNTQPFDLTTVMHEDELSLHLTGTAFFLPLRDPRLEACRDCWNQELVSETSDIYRAEYAAYLMYQQFSRPAATPQKGTGTRPKDDAAAEESAGPQSLDDLRRLEPKELQTFVTKWMAPRYTEGYIKGVHDHDATRILKAMLDIDAGVGLLRYPSRARAMAALYWEHFIDRRTRTRLEGRIRGFGTVASLFPTARAQDDYTTELREFLTEFAQEQLLFPQRYVHQAADYLLAELQDGDGWVISRTAADLCREFHLHLQHNDSRPKFDEAFSGLKKDPVGQFLQLRDWLEAWARATDLSDDQAESLDEAAVMLLLYGEPPVEQIADVELFRDLEDMAGDHPRIAGGRYHLNWLHLQERLSEYEAGGAARFREFGQLKKQLVDEAREDMRLDEFRPRVMTSFVRNRLIDEVYLPLIGANLARQIGAAGDQKRTDRMGLLLLISPPGYGKTTLMEYVANRLGIIFMKINGPALGHQVTSLDPAAAPNAGAREEIEKLNLSFEMGDNVMIYVDDIQHCHPEFLQKFISLCDAQRKIEGVSRGRTRTFDFRGKKVAVVMAGNPYTESGEKFQIPDMLANRADIYNLGEIIGDSADAFEMSYLENSLTSNPVLSRLATRPREDIHAIIRMADRGTREGIDLEGSYSADELNDFVAAMEKLIRVRNVILRVNREYINSAAQSDEYRTEPAFKLQGSYRNMNRIAERVVPMMNDQELETLIVSTYEGDAQTLTSGAEANLLKFREMLEILTETEAARWEEIQRKFRQNNRLKGVDDSDRFGQAIVQLSAFSEGLDGIRSSLDRGMTELIRADDAPGPFDAHLTDFAARIIAIEQSLAAIGQSLEGGVQQMAGLAETFETRTSTRADSPDQAVPVEALRQLLAELRSLPAAAGLSPATDPGASTDPDDEQSSGAEVVDAGTLAARQARKDPHRITVVNRIPPTLLDVLRQQFELMHSWMEPVFRAVQSQQTEMVGLKRSLDETLASYAGLIEKLGVARSRNRNKDE